MQMSIRPVPREGFLILFLPNSKAPVSLAQGATISVNISVVKVTGDPSFVILTGSQLMDWLYMPPRPLPQGGWSNYLICSWRMPLKSTIDIVYNVSGRKPEEYWIGVLTEPMMPIEVEGTVSFENPGGQHLSLEMVGYPETVRCACMAFLLLAVGVAIGFFFKLPRGMNALHSLFFFCITAKVSELFYKWRYFKKMEEYGIWSRESEQFWKITKHAHESCQLMMWLLLALGWRVRPSGLHPQETRVVATFLLQGFLSTSVQAMAIADGFTFQQLMTLKLGLFMSRFVQILLVYFLMDVHLRMLADHIKDSPLSLVLAKDYQQYEIMKNCKSYFLLSFAAPSAMLGVQVAIFGRDSGRWILEILQQTSFWVLYFFMFLTLLPSGPPARITRLLREVQTGSINNNDNAGAPEDLQRREAAPGEGEPVRSGIASSSDISRDVAISVADDVAVESAVPDIDAVPLIFNDVNGLNPVTVEGCSGDDRESDIPYVPLADSE